MNQLTQKEKLLFDKMTLEEYKALIIKSARTKLGNQSMCINSIKYITKNTPFSQAVQAIVDNSNGWI